MDTTVKETICPICNDEGFIASTQVVLDVVRHDHVSSSTDLSEQVHKEWWSVTDKTFVTLKDAWEYAKEKKYKGDKVALSSPWVRGWDALILRGNKMEAEKWFKKWRHGARRWRVGK